MNGQRSQRWRDRREAFIPDASEINPAHFTVAAVGKVEAKAFVQRHHYSGTYPAARLSVGLYRGRQLAGVAVFSVPMNEHSVKRHTGLASPLHGVDLGRFVLLDDVAGNGETWFLSRALRVLRQEKPEVVAVVSCADPQPRLAPTGEVVKPGHIGLIYKSMSALYRGRTRPRFEAITPDGQLFSERAVSKLRAHDQGHAYAVAELVRRGAERPALGDDLGVWFDGLIATGFIRRRRHPGNHVYAFPLTKGAKIAGRGLPTAPYPETAHV